MDEHLRLAAKLEKPDEGSIHSHLKERLLQPSRVSPVSAEKNPDTVTSAEAVSLALKLGTILYRSGASSKRTNDMLESLLTRLGFEDFGIFISYTHLSVSIEQRSGKMFTRMTHLESGVHLGNLVNATKMVHDLPPDWASKEFPSYETLMEMLEELKRAPRYGHAITAFQVAVSCACLCLMIGSDLSAMLIAWIAAVLGVLIRLTLDERGVNIYLIWGTTAWSAASISLILSSFVITTTSPKTAMIAPALMLIPGVPVVNAVMDLVRGYADIGIARITFLSLLIIMISQSVLIASIPFNAHLMLGNTEFWRPEAPAPDSFTKWAPWAHGLADAFLSGLASLGFAFLFQVPLNLFPQVYAVGCIGHGLKAFLMDAASHGLRTGMITFVSTTCMVIAAEAMGKAGNVPAVVFYVPGIVIMMPGAFIINSILGQLWIVESYSQDPTNVIDYLPALFSSFSLLIRAVMVIGGIGFGVAVPSLLLRDNFVNCADKGIKHRLRNKKPTKCSAVHG